MLPSRRKKPLYRPRNILLALALLFVLAIGREVYLAMTATPGQAVDYAAKVAELIDANQPKDVPPDSPNAVEILDRAIAIEQQIVADYRSRFQLEGGQVLDYSILRGPMSTKGYAPGVFEQIKTNSLNAIADLRKTECFDLMAQVAAARRAVRPTPQGGGSGGGRLISFLLPNLGRYRNFARLNGSRMYLAHQAGDDAELVAAFEQTLAVGRVAGHGSFLIEHLVAIAIDVLALIELRTELVERPPGEATLLKLLAAMDRQGLPPMRLTIEGERLSVLDTIQWTHTDDGRGSGRLIAANLTQIGAMSGVGGGGWLDRASTWRIVNLGGAAFPSKAANIRKANQFFDLVVAAAEQPFYARGRMMADLDDLYEKLPTRYVLLHMMLPACGKTIQSGNWCSTQWAGTRAMLGLEIFRHRHGKYPASLDELVPSVLSEMPLDPFSGRALGYRVIDPATDKHGREYLLYSVGADQTDNGGMPAAKIDVDALRLPAGLGFDFVFNVPRDRPDLEDQPEPVIDVPPPEPAPAPPAPPATPEQPPSPSPSPSS